MKNLIALITDFGNEGQHYVASMKGVILKINPDVKIVDLSHNISSYSIIEASYILISTYRFFPEQTVFVIVVDPGVGSSREVIALKTESNYYFVGPNNGIFSWIFELDKIVDCINVQNKTYFNNPVSSTFHGRDIMAPVGAFLTKGITIEKFGTSFDQNNLIRKNLEYNIIQDEGKVRCEIQFIDSFGNIITNILIETNYSFGEFDCISGTSLTIKEGEDIQLLIKNKEYKGIYSSYYANFPVKSLLLLRGSSDFLEISLNQGNAAKELDIKIGDIIEIKL